MWYMCRCGTKQWLLVFLLLDRNNLDHFLIVILDKLWCRLSDLVLVVFFYLDFPIKKHYFLICFVFCVSFAIRRCVLFQCVASNFYHENHKLIVHVRCGAVVHCLILYDLGIFQVCLECKVWKNLKPYQFLEGAFICSQF